MMISIFLRFHSKLSIRNAFVIDGKWNWNDNHINRNLINVKAWVKNASYFKWKRASCCIRFYTFPVWWATRENDFSPPIYMQKKTQFNTRTHLHALRGETVYDLNIIVFSNLQKHSMNFKLFFSYKWFLFMPNEHFVGGSKARVKKEGKQTGRRIFLFFDKWVLLIETATQFCYAASSLETASGPRYENSIRKNPWKRNKNAVEENRRRFVIGISRKSFKKTVSLASFFFFCFIFSRTLRRPSQWFLC